MNVIVSMLRFGRKKVSHDLISNDVNLKLCNEESES